MKQINLNNINWTRIFAITTLILAIIVYFQNCTGSANEPTVLATKIDTVQENHIDYKNTIDSLEVEILDLQNKNQTISQNHKAYTNTRFDYVEKFKELPFRSQQTYFDENYKKEINPLAFNQIDSLQSSHIILDIENGKTALGRINYFESEISNYKSQITNFEKISQTFEKDIEAHVIALDECEAYLHEIQKKTWLKMNAGASFGINKELNQFMYGGQLLFEGKKGHITNLNYLRIGNADYFLAGKSWKVFEIKK